ncbi:MAG: FMN-binding protein [Firmicutes bacterium]|nr:FMN-binding protein [Bacillota bacterium]
MIKKSMILLISLLLVAVLSLNILAAEANYKDGHYLGFVANDHGDVVIEVIIKHGQIVDLNMINPFKLHYEYAEGKKAFLEYPYMVLENQSTQVDGITGATHSMHDYNEAVDMALAIASGNYQGNKYYGLAEDFEHGHVIVEITVENKEITDARLVTANPELVDNEDGREKLMPAKAADYGSKSALEYFNSFPEKVVENQGKVDVLTGATHSGESYNEALDMALIQAGLK